MLLGLAIGDSLGNTSEGMLPAMRNSVRGEICDYLPNGYVGGKSFGLPSDDTQMAFWTLESILEKGAVEPDDLAQKFSTRTIFGRGSSVGEFVRNYQAGKAWPEAAARSAGNGALMRIAPVLVPHLKHPSPNLWSDAALAAAVTHNDRASISSCVAFVGILWEVLGKIHFALARLQINSNIRNDLGLPPRNMRDALVRGSSKDVLRLLETVD